MSALKQNLVVRRLFSGGCKGACDPQMFQKHTMTKAAYWNKKVNTPKMRKRVCSGAEGET
jgi:hypothetical protein